MFMLYNNVGTTLCAKVLVVGTRKRKVSLFVTPTVTSSSAGNFHCARQR